jgi:hypothetical protein
MNSGSFSRDDLIIGGLALLLAIDLFFLPWFDVSGGLCNIVSCTSTATGDPDAWLGILAAIADIALIADLAIERLSPQTALPNIGGSRTTTRLVLAGIVAGLLLLKFLFQISHFSDLGFGFWAALVLTVALVVATLRVNQGQPIVRSGPAGPAA